MSDITYSMTLRVDKENLSTLIAASGVTADMSSVGMKSMTLTLTTSTVSISTANLTSVGMAFLRNLSTATASTVQWGVVDGTSFTSVGTLRAGEPAILRLTSGSSYAAKGTAGTLVRVDIIEG